MIDQDEIHNQCLSKNPEDRIKALEKLKDNFSFLLDKQQAWIDLHELNNDKDSNVRYNAVKVTSSVFSHVLDKQQAWNDLIRLTNDESSSVRSSAAKALGSAFSYVPDKQQAWNDLHRLTIDQKVWLRSSAAIALASAFSHFPYNQISWNGLYMITKMPDKQKAWNDLHRLTNDKEWRVRYIVANALGSFFSQVPDEYKQRACDDLHRLTNDKDWKVKASSNYSLGRVSIIKASQAKTDKDYEKQLEKAIEFYEKASREPPQNYKNPSLFCLPFYRSFHTIIFKKQEAKNEADKYLKEAKDAIKGSKSKELLLEAVNNLSNALNEVQSLENMDLNSMKEELKFYRKYCDRAEELMRETEESTPYVTEVLRKGLPILDRNLKELLKEIQGKAKTACNESIRTPTQEIACTVNKEVQKWEIGNQEEMSWHVKNLVVVLKSKIPHSLENKEILDMIEYMKYERDLTKQYRILSTVIGLIPTVSVVSEQELDIKLDKKLQNFDRIFNEIIYIGDKLSCIKFDIANIKWNSADVVSNLKTMKEELEKLNRIEGLNTLSIENLNSSQVERLNYLNRDMLGRLNEVKTLIDDLPKNNDTLEFYDKLNELKQSKPDILLQRSSGVISLIGFAMQLYQLYKPV